MKRTGNILRAVMLAGCSGALWAGDPVGVPMGPPKIWTANGWEPVPGNSDYSVGGGGSDRPRGPTQRELAAQAARERRAKASDFNVAGIDAWNRGDWGIAAEQFRQAYAWNPDSKVIFENLIKALYRRGFAALDAGEWDYAANTFQSLSYHKPNVQEYRDLQAHARGKLQLVKDAYAINRKGRAAFDRGDLSEAEALFAEAARLNPTDPAYRKNLAVVRDDLGSTAFEAGDSTKALALWASALAADPADERARNNITNVKKYLEDKRRHEAVVTKVQQEITTLAQDLQADKPATGLNLDDFDPATTPAVNAQDVPSGLPPAVDTAIAGAFASAPSGVSDRVRKGFQAVAERDWKVAQAWFEDALNHDPDNAGLKNLLAAARTPPLQDQVRDLYRSGYDAVAAGDRAGAIAAFEEARRRDPDHQSSIGPFLDYLKATADAPKLLLPKDSDMELLFDLPPSPTGTPPKPSPTFIIDDNGRLKQVPANTDQPSPTYILGTDGKLMQVPQPADANLLFPGNTPGATSPRPATPFMQLLLDALKPAPRPRSQVGSSRG